MVSQRENGTSCSEQKKTLCRDPSHPEAKVSTEMKTHLSAHPTHIGSITVKGQATAIQSNPNLGVYGKVFVVWIEEAYNH